jgi:uncharacterized protein (TIGR02118 family)
MYGHIEGARFDHEYYRDVHMPLVQKLLGSACSYYTVDRGLAGGSPGSAPHFIAMCHIYSPTLEDFNRAMQPNAREILADVSNFTELTPVLQISDVVVERSCP